MVFSCLLAGPSRNFGVLSSALSLAGGARKNGAMVVCMACREITWFQETFLILRPVHVVSKCKQIHVSWVYRVLDEKFLLSSTAAVTCDINNIR